MYKRRVGVTRAVMHVQAHNQAKSSATNALVKAQAGKEQKEQEVAELHHALEEANRKLQVSAAIARQATVKSPFTCTFCIVKGQMSILDQQVLSKASTYSLQTHLACHDYL